MEAEGCSVEVRADGAAVVVSVRGELDMASAPALTEVLTDASAKADRVVVDLGAVTFIDSSAIGALVSSGRSIGAGGGRLQIGDRSPTVTQVLEITGLLESSEAFDVLPDGA